MSSPSVCTSYAFAPPESPPVTYPIDRGATPEIHSLTAHLLHVWHKMDLGVLEVELQKFISK